MSYPIACNQPCNVTETNCCRVIATALVSSSQIIPPINNQIGLIPGTTFIDPTIVTLVTNVAIVEQTPQEHNFTNSNGLDSVTLNNGIFTVSVAGTYAITVNLIFSPALPEDPFGTDVTMTILQIYKIVRNGVNAGGIYKQMMGMSSVQNEISAATTTMGQMALLAGDQVFVGVTQWQSDIAPVPINLIGGRIVLKRL